MAIRVIAQLQPKQRAVEVTLDELPMLRESAVWVWIDLESEAAHTVEQLCSSFGFDPFAVEDVLDIELLPKWEDYGSHIYVVLHALIADEDHVDTREVDAFITDRIMVTAHDSRVASVQAMVDALMRHPTALGCSDPSVVLARLGEMFGRRFMEVLVELERRIDALSEPALHGDSTVLGEVQVLRREESTIRTILWPQRQVLASLRFDDSPLLSTVGRRRFEDAFDIHNQLVESLTAARELLTNTLDTYRGAANDQLAGMSRVLTVYAAIMLPLTVVTGFFGMNFASMPLINWRHGALAISIALGLMASLSLFFFAARGWIGGPTMQRRSRRAAQGLAGAATRPIRPLTGDRRNHGSRSN